jgi:proteasome lid subunit RPN8/RPN11
VKILHETLEFICEASRNVYPREFAGFLRSENDIITEVLLSPGGLSGSHGAVVHPTLLPLDSSIMGTVHSHPGRMAYPSEEDIRFFGKFGHIHIIVRYPFALEDAFFFDKEGQRIECEIVD